MEYNKEQVTKKTKSDNFYTQNITLLLQCL